MHIKRSIRFILHNRKAASCNEGGKEKPLAIRLRVAYNCKSLDVATGLHCLPSDWDGETYRVNATDTEAESKNRVIDNYAHTMEDIFIRYELIEKRIPTTGELKDLFRDMMGKPRIKVPTPEDDLFEVFDKFTESCGRKNQWTKATFAKFEAVKARLKDFDANLAFNAIDDDKMNEYLEYLNRKKMRNTTIAKNISFVKWFLRWAEMYGYYSGHAHKSFKPRLKGVNGDGHEIIYLDQKELRTLQNYAPTANKQYLGRVRDVFLFCCFTGLRYSDVAKLTHADVKEGYIDIVTKKTVDGIRIELNKHSQAILDKYKGKEYKGDKVFPVISNQRMNEYLKELCEVCGIDTPTKVVYFLGNERIEETYPKFALVSTHCGRRTFVVNALRLGIPAEVIIRWTGHADYKSMKPYIKIVDELKKSEMSKFDDF